MSDISVLIGKTIAKIDKEYAYGGRIVSLIFHCDDGSRYKMHHDEQQGSEEIILEDISGDLEDLVGTPMLTAEVRTNESSDQEYDADGDWHYTWTFYTFATKKGYVGLRWVGKSNGYYSEEVYFSDITNKDDEDCDL
jgi:hypothetical protein